MAKLIKQNRGGAHVAARVAESGHTDAAIERRFGMANGYLRRLISGERKPGYALRAAIRDEWGTAMAWWDQVVEVKEASDGQG